MKFRRWSYLRETVLTIGEGEIKLTGPVKSGVATLTNSEISEKMVLSDIFEVSGKTFNKGGMVVSNVSGVLECQEK